MRRGVAGGMVVLACIGLCAAALTLTRQPVPVSFPIGVDELTIDGPVSADAGESFDVDVAGGGHGQLVTLTVDTGYGPRSFQALSRDDRASFSIPPTDGPSSGIALLTARALGRVGTSTVEITPGPARGPVDVFVGPRTVVANNDDFSMLVVVPTDQFGNPVADGTEVVTQVTRQSLEAETLRSATAGLLTHERVVSGTTAGRTRLGVQVGNEIAPERSFLEVADVPERFSLALVDPLPPADGHALVRIRTSELRDRFNNPLPDGTVVFLDAAGASGTRRLRSVTVEAVAEFVFEVPDMAGSVDLIATASGRESDALVLRFESAIRSFEVNVEPQPDGTLILVGPVISTRQSFVPDGTIATVTTPSGEITVPLELGAASVVVAEVSGRVDVGVLGEVVSIDLDGQP